MSTGKHRLALAGGIGLCLVLVLLWQAASYKVNQDGFAASAKPLDSQRRKMVGRLVEAETRDLVRSEEAGLIYYSSAERTGQSNRVYLLWAIHDAAVVRPPLAAMPAADDRPLGVAIYVDLGFSTFKGRYRMLLSRLFATEGLRRVRAASFRWDEARQEWQRGGELDNEAALRLLTEEQKRAVRNGAYNLVYVDEDKGRK